MKRRKNELNDSRKLKKRNWKKKRGERFWSTSRGPCLRRCVRSAACNVPIGLCRFHSLPAASSSHSISTSSQEKKKLQEKELDDLDDLLGEFGVSADANTSIVEEKKVDDDAVLASDQGADAAAKKKKKKPKKKSNKSSSAESEDWVQVDAPESSKGEEKNEPAVVDVAAVLKSKAKTKEKTVAEIAAATAAKEAKAKAAKKEAEEKKKVSLL